VVVESGYPAQKLINATSATFTVNGTAAFQASVAGKIGISSNAYYGFGDLHIFNRSFDDLATVGHRLRLALEADSSCAVEKTVSHYLRLTLPGTADYLLSDFRSRDLLSETAKSLRLVLEKIGDS
jgi:hypothetical protein